MTIPSNNNEKNRQTSFSSKFGWNNFIFERIIICVSRNNFVIASSLWRFYNRINFKKFLD